jgi:hypothetical protein
MFKKFIGASRFAVNSFINQKTTARYPGHNDVYLVAFPKSGVTWLSTMLANMALIASGRKETASFLSVHQFIPDIHVTKNISPVVYHTPPVRLIKSHSTCNPNYIYVIYLVRHPLDVMKSYYRFTRELNDSNYNSFDDFCHCRKKGIPAWKRHIYSWFDGKPAAQRIHLCRYEAFLSNSVDELSLISENFGWNIDLDVIKQAVKRSSVNAMKASEELFRQHNPCHTITFVRGATDFEISDDTIDYIRSSCKNELQSTGYSPD